MAQVVVPILRPVGSVGLDVQDVTVPETVGVIVVMAVFLVKLKGLPM